MMLSALLLLGLLAAVGMTAASAKQQSVYALIAYPNTEFTSKGVVVSIDPSSGKWALVSSPFHWPSQIFGRPYSYDPAYTFDAASGTLFLDFGADFGYLVEVDVRTGDVTTHFMHSDPFFVGFTSFVEVPQQKKLVGVSPVGNDHGIFSFGKLELESHKYTNMSLIKFKAIMDDTEYYDVKSQTYSVQGDYDQRKGAASMCPGGKELCMINIDSTSGSITSTYKTNYTIYKLNAADPADAVTAWVDYAPQQCAGSKNGFLFGKIAFPSGKLTPGACISPRLVIQEEPWISAFSGDGSLFATGSRFAQSTEFLVFDTATGKTVVDSTLPGLAEELKPAEGMYYIWGLGFA